MSVEVGADAIQKALIAPLTGPVRWLAEVPSTNDEVIAAAREGLPEGLIVGADHQTAGRGRRGRSWTDRPESSLAMSVLLRPRSSQAAGLLPLVVALGVAEGLSRLVAEPIGIVWPNDLVADDKKLTGILCEMGWRGTEVAWAVAGVGINVNSAPAPAPGARFEPTCLKQLGFDGSRSEVAIAALQGLAHRYAEWQSVGEVPMLEAYRERDALRGRHITVSVDGADTSVVGEGEGIDAEGRLVVRSEVGQRHFAAAEVQHVRR